MISLISFDITKDLPELRKLRDLVIKPFDRLCNIEFLRTISLWSKINRHFSLLIDK